MNCLSPRRLALAIAVLLLVSGRGGVTAEPTRLGTAELSKVFTELLPASNTALAKGDFEITHFSATPESLELPPGRLEYRPCPQPQAKPLGRQTLVVEVLVNGQAVRRVTLSGDLALYGEVVCTRRAIPRHQVLTADDLESVRRNLTILGPDLITDPLLVVGKEVTTTLQPGAALYGRLVKSPPAIKRGDIVSIRATTDLITITVPGRVLTAGATGDRIRVKNLMSRKEIVATVVGPDTVQAEL